MSAYLQGLVDTEKFIRMAVLLFTLVLGIYFHQLVSVTVARSSYMNGLNIFVCNVPPSFLLQC